jgi:hypothetical protein
MAQTADIQSARSWVIAIRDAWQALHAVASEGYASEAGCIRSEWCAANAVIITGTLEGRAVLPELAAEWVTHRNAVVINHIWDAQRGVGPLAEWWSKRG